MAESFVNMTEGSGKKAHTFQRVIGANTIEDEVVLLGENYLASYTIAVDTVVVTPAGQALTIMAGSSLKVRIRRVEIFQNVMATTAALVEVRLLRLTTASSGGTTVTPNPLDTTDSAFSGVARVLPSSGGTESSVIAIARPYLMQTIGASAQLNQPIAVWDFDRPRSKPLIIAAGTSNGIAVKNATAHAGATIGMTIWLDESNF